MHTTYVLSNLYIFLIIWFLFTDSHDEDKREKLTRENFLDPEFQPREFYVTWIDGKTCILKIPIFQQENLKHKKIKFGQRDMRSEYYHYPSVWSLEIQSEEERWDPIYQFYSRKVYRYQNDIQNP